MLTTTVEPHSEIDQECLMATVEPRGLAGFPKARETRLFIRLTGEKSATLGGNSTNAGGMRAVKYGVTRITRHGSRKLFNGEVTSLEVSLQELVGLRPDASHDRL